MSNTATNNNGWVAPEATLGQQIEAAALLTDSLMAQVQELESGPFNDEHTWNEELARKLRHFNTMCEVLSDLRMIEAKDAMRDEDDRDLEDEWDLDHVPTEPDVPATELFEALRAPVCEEHGCSGCWVCDW